MAQSQKGTEGAQGAVPQDPGLYLFKPDFPVIYQGLDDHEDDQGWYQPFDKGTQTLLF